MNIGAIFRNAMVKVVNIVSGFNV